MKKSTQVNCAVLAGATLFGVAAWPLSPASAADGREANPDAGTSSAPSGQLEEIVVTAQRRSERLQDVPIAVSTITADAMARAGISSTNTLQLAVPGLDLGRQSGNGGSPYLRGVGTNASIAGTEPPVAIYLDDVYLGTAQASILQFNSIEQIEVLKGPQGTLFGRNATGGVIQIRSRRPSFNPAFDANIGYGNYNTVDGALYASGALASKVAASISLVGHKQFDGYGRNSTTGEDVSKSWNYGILGRVLLQPGDDTSVIISADYSQQWSDQGLEYQPYPGTITAGGARFQGPYVATVTPGSYAKFDFAGVSARLDHELGFAKFVSISSYRQTSQRALFDQDRGPTNVLTADVTSLTRNVSQEFQLQSKEQTRLSWIVGVYYFRSDAGLRPLRSAGSSQAANGGFNDVRNDQILNSYAAFADGRYEVLPRTNITLGVRYTRDDYDLHVDPTRNALGQTLVGGFSTGASFPKLTFRAVVDHKITSDVMLYASFSRGFKSGGYNLGGAGGPPFGAPPVSPEVLDAYEIGLKSEFFNRRLRANLSAYRYKYGNLQTNVVIGSTATLINAASATISGVDADFEAVVTDRLTLSLGGSFIDGKYKSFPGGQAFIPNPAVCTPTPVSTGPATGGTRQCGTDLAGNSVIRTPKFTGSATATYKIPTQVGEFALSSTLYYNSGYYWSPDNRIKQNAYRLLNSTLSWTSPSRQFEIDLWGSNLLDNYYLEYAVESTSGYVRSAASPRTYGIRAGYHF